ncbi:unnamed protein product [Symbiodinium sp. CCMP2592]|nr:unnamed protein product [Symbiodinium sp. CCMP2592]
MVTQRIHGITHAGVRRRSQVFSAPEQELERFFFLQQLCLCSELNKWRLSFNNQRSIEEYGTECKDATQKASAHGQRQEREVVEIDD